MKNLTKIFMAVVAGMFAFSCATDTTEDLGVQVGGGEGLTTITLSLEESRVQLGEKNPTTKLYPLYWTAGDKISVNGVEAEAQISETNHAVATFMVAEAEKYEVVYPATNTGVLFAEKQNHVVEGNTFESGVSTMYGTGVAGEPIALHHLTGVLKFAVKGSAVLSKIQISTIDRAPIAGTFDINFETGELKATTASKSVIEYSFGEAGLQLTEEAQWMHVAVPAGQYDELYVTLYDNADGVMYATVKAGESKPLTPGNVREFKNPIPYAAVNEEDVFVISSAQDLADFKTAIEAGEGLAKNAVLTEDIDMTDVEWTAIAGTNYTGTIHGNGYAIKGLTAPLFNKAAASFKGLHLVDVNINTNDVYRLGAFVTLHQHTTSGQIVVVENCSVSGTIEVNNPTLAGTTNAIYGGFVGTAVCATFDSCVSDVDIKIVQLNETNRSKKVYIGGICGYVEGRTPSYATFVNSKNYGNIDMSGCEGIVITTEAAIGGIVGNSCADADKNNFGLVIDNCENNGGITIYGAIKNLYLGGISGYAPSSADVKATISNTTNKGAITIKSGAYVSTDLNLGGIAGKHSRSTEDPGIIINSTNDATGTITVERGVTFNQAMVGGIVGYHLGGASGILQECTNNGAINFGGDAISAEKITTVFLGGVAGYTQGTIKDVVNNGHITISGNLNQSAAAVADTFKKGTTIYIGGAIGYKTEGSVSGIANHGNLNVSSTITSLLTDGQQSQVNIGGLIGYNSKDAVAGAVVTKCISDGEINVTGNTTGCQLCIGGVYGHIYVAITNQTSASKIKVSGTHTGNLYVGGITPAHVAKALSNCTFTGSIDIAGTIGGETVVGGIVGHTALPITGSKAYCDIAATENAKVGFITGMERTDTVIASNCQVGGTLASVVVTPGTPEHEDPNSGTLVPGTPDTFEKVSYPIDANNWFKHIYSTEVTEDVATTDGCSLIESAPAI